MLNKALYQKYRALIKNTSVLYQILDSLHESFPEVSEFTRDDYVTFAQSKIKPDSDESIMIEQLRNVNITDVVLQDVLLDLQQKAKAYDLALLAVDVSEGKNSYENLLTEVSNLCTIDVPVEEEVFVTDDLEELYQDAIQNQGFRWRLNTLNQMLGSLRKGDFGFVFARPETGKTTFLASEISFFGGQTKQFILWFNNEEEGRKVQRRIFQAAVGVDLQTLYSDRPKYQEMYNQLTGRRIKLIDNASLHRNEVERICKKIEPGLIVFDQIDKIKGFDSDREDLRLGAIYQWARELAKTYCPVIGVCQADGSGEGKKWLTMENVSNAKTSKQAEADFIIGIGRTNEAGMEYVRHIHLSKNKLSGDQDTIAELRHGRRDVIIRPEYARYEDVG